MNISKHLSNGVCEITLSGKFTFNDHPEFREVLDLFADANVEHMVLRIGGIDFIDSAALGMMLIASDEAKKYSKKITLRGATGQVKKMLDMAGFDKLFTIEA